MSKKLEEEKLQKERAEQLLAEKKEQKFRKRVNRVAKAQGLST